MKCICTELCTEGAVREDCPVCAAEGADLSDCKGVETETQPESGEQKNETTPEEEGAGKLEGKVALIGTYQYGETLTAIVTDAPPEAKLTYRFYRGEGGELVKTGDSNQYKVTANDVGYKISVKVEVEGYAEELEATTPLSVEKREISVKAKDLSKTYGEEDPPLTWDFPANGLVEGDQLKGKLTRAAGENAGTYAISQGTLTNENNPGYDIQFVEGTLKIEKAPYTEKTTAALDSKGRQTVIAGIGSFAEP